MMLRDKEGELGVEREDVHAALRNPNPCQISRHLRDTRAWGNKNATC